MYQNKFLILFLTLNVVLIVNCSPVFEPSENIVEDNVTDNTDDPAFDHLQGDQRANDNFGDMNDFNFETPQRDEENQNAQQEGNQSAEQQDDSDGPNGSSPQHARERPIGKTAEEEQDSGDGESDEQRGGRGNADSPKNKQRYQDGEENGSARSLDSFDKDNSFDKENIDDKNEFESNDGEANRQNSGEEQNGQMPPHQIGGPNGIPPLQIDEPILVNGPGGPMPMPLHGRPPMQGRSNSEEDNGDKIKK